MRTRAELDEHATKERQRRALRPKMRPEWTQRCTVCGRSFQKEPGGLPACSITCFERKRACAKC